LYVNHSFNQIFYYNYDSMLCRFFQRRRNRRAQNLVCMSIFER